MGKYLDDYAEASKKANTRFRRQKDFEVAVVAYEFHEEPDRVNVRVKHDEDRYVLDVPVMQPSAGDGYGEYPELHLPEPGMLRVPDTAMDEIRKTSDSTDGLDHQRDHALEDGHFVPGYRYDDQEAIESNPADHDYQHKDGYRERFAEGGGHFEEHPSGHTVQTDEGGTLIASPGDEQLCYVSGDGLFMASAASEEYGGGEAGSDSDWTDNPVAGGEIDWEAYCTAEVTEAGCTLSTPTENGERSTQTVTPEGIGSVFPTDEEMDAAFDIDGESCRIQFPTEDGGTCDLELTSESIQCTTDEAELSLEDDKFRCVNESGSEILSDGEDVACVSPDGAAVGCSGETMFASDAAGNSLEADGNSITAESTAGHSMTVDQEGVSAQSADGTEFTVEDGEITAKTSDDGELSVTDSVGISDLESETIANSRYREQIIEETISGTHVIDPAEANVYHLTLEGDVVIEFAETDGEFAENLFVVITQDSVGGHALEWPSDTFWHEGDPHEITRDADATDAISFAQVSGDWIGIPSAYNLQTP